MFKKFQEIFRPKSKAESASAPTALPLSTSVPMTISVVLPNYNHGHYLKDNLNGLRSQTYQNWELNIVDDGSSDNSVDVITSYAAKDARIKPIFFEKNQGVFPAVHAALEAAKGGWIYCSAADDFVSNPHFFSKAMDALTTTPAAGFFGSASVVDGETLAEKWVMGCAPTEGYIPPANALKAFLHSEIFVPGVAAIWRRDLIEQWGSYDAALGPQCDYYLNHALPALKGVIFCSEKFTTCRLNPKSYGSDVGHKDYFLRHALVEKKLKELPLPDDYDPIWFNVWRENIINARLGITRQMGFIKLVDEKLAEIQPWEKASLSPLFLDAVDAFKKDLISAEQDIAQQVAEAHNIFNEHANLTKAA